MKEISRKGRTSLTNGVIGVVMKYNGDYDWLISKGTNCHGASTLSYDKDKLYPIILQNHFNSSPPQWHCDQCETYDYYNGSYISYIEEDNFLYNPQKYIENAYDKSENTSAYTLIKKR